MIFPSAPGAYNVVKLDSSPAFTMRPKTGVDKISEVPAPNAYEPEKALRAIKQNGPSYPFGVRPHIDPIDETPGLLYFIFLLYESRLF